MARRKSTPMAYPAPFEEPPCRQSDHLEGQHYESFLSPTSHPYTPQTPLSATVNQPDADCEERHWMRLWNTPEGILRRTQANQGDPGGKTILRGDILGE